MEISVEYTDKRTCSRKENVATLEELGKLCKVLQNAGIFYKINMTDNNGYMTLATGPVHTH